MVVEGSLMVEEFGWMEKNSKNGVFLQIEIDGRSSPVTNFSIFLLLKFRCEILTSTSCRRSGVDVGDKNKVSETRS